MNLQRLEVSTTHKQLPNRTTARGIKSGSSLGLLLCFGILFLLSGSFSLVFFFSSPTFSFSAQPQFWIPSALGLIFILAGWALLGTALHKFHRQRKLREASRWHPGEPAHADYIWDTREFQPPRWTPTIRAFLVAMGLTLFLSIFNWVFLLEKDVPLFAKIIIGVFNVILLLLWIAFFTRVAYAFKFGGSRLEFLQFPYHTNAPVTLRWHSGYGITHIHKGSFTLRCVVEKFEQRRSGSKTTTVLIQTEIWSATHFLDEPLRLTRSESVDISFHLPPNAEPTLLNSDNPIFWEFEAKLDLPGLDFNELYLVPIYS